MAEIKFLKGLSTNWQPTDINQNYFYIVEDATTHKLSLYLGSVLLADGHAAQELANEITARIAADSALQEQITKLDEDIQDKIAEEIAAVIGGADSSFDTLKEIADWIVNDTTGAAKMANDIADLQEQAHEHANKALLDTYTQTEADLADAVIKKHEHSNKAILDGISTEKVSSWDSAEQNAKAYADGLAADYDEAGAAAQALQDAKAYADSLANNYDVAGSAAAAETAAKSYADSLAVNYDAKGSAAAAEAAAKAYADEQDVKVITSAKEYVDAEDANVLSEAKSYADSLADNYDAKGSAETAEKNAKDYADSLLTWGTF